MIEHDGTAGSAARRWVGRLAAGLAAGAVALVLTVAGAEPAAAVGASASQSNPLSALTYSIRTRYDAGGGCTGERVVPATIGLPRLVDVGGTSLPDLAVTLVAIPGSTLGGPDQLQLLVTNLRPASPPKALVEVVLAPSSESAERVALGYDACEAGAPLLFLATVTATPERIVLRANTTGPQAALTVLGSTFDADGAKRADPTAVSARLEPVPNHLAADVDVLGESSYRARLATDVPTNLRLGLEDRAGTSYTTAKAAVEQFPGRLDLTFRPDRIAYTASAAIDHLEVGVESYTPAPAGEDPAQVSRIGADLLGVPAAATIVRDGPTHLTFTTPGRIGSATVRYASFLPGVTPPVLTPLRDQYLVADIGLDHTIAEARVLDLSRADIDAGDRVVVDLTHRAGPFRASVKAVTQDEDCEDCEPDEEAPIVTRRITADVLDLPATARVTFHRVTQAFTYDGSAPIGELQVHLTSSEPLVDDATASHLRMVSVPTGLTGRLDAVARRFTATLTGGAIETVEAQLTSGPDDRLPLATDGLMLHDRADRYVVFLRVSGLQSATVGWGRTKVATVTHAPGPFRMEVLVDDPDAEGIILDGTITDLPATAHIEYTPGSAPQLEQARVGGPPIGTVAQPTKLAYAGSDTIDQITFDVVTEQPVSDSAELHVPPDTVRLHARNVPKGLTVTTDSTSTTAATVDGQLGVLQIELCSALACRPQPALLPGDTATDAEPDGAWLSNRSTGFNLLTRVRGLTSLRLGTGATTSVELAHAAGPFDVHTVADKVEDVLVPVPFPGGSIPIPTPFVENVDVVIRDLPATVAVAFTPEDGRVVYTGSAKIPSLDIRYSKGVIPIAGRGHHLHVDLDGLPSGVDLRYSFGEDGEHVLLDTGSEKIDHVALELLSDPALMTKPGIQQYRIVSAGWDGFLAWDLDDGAPGEDGINDPYVMIARVTNLQRFEYNAAEGVIGDGTIEDLDLELVRQPHADGTALPEVAVDMLGMDPANEHTAIEGFPNHYRLEFLYVTYYGPPDHLGFMMTKRVDPRSDQDDAKVFYIDAYGSSEGGRLEVQTDKGALDFLDLALDRVPAGTREHPGVDTCLSPNTMACVEDQYDAQGLAESPFSVTADFRGPVDLYVDANVDALRVLVYDAVIDRRLYIGKEKSTKLANSTLAYLDTDGAAVQAQVRIYDGSDLTTVVKVPPGTRAYDRFVEIENEGVNEERNTGVLLCPHDFDAHAFLVGQSLSLNDDICTTSIVTAVSQETITAGDPTPRLLDLYGWSFVPGTTDADGDWFEGTHVHVGHGDQFEVSGWTWLGPDHLQVLVTPKADVPPGEYPVFVTNNTDSRRTEDSPRACSCTVRVTPRFDE